MKGKTCRELSPFSARVYTKLTKTNNLTKTDRSENANQSVAFENAAFSKLRKNGLNALRTAVVRLCLFYKVQQKMENAFVAAVLSL